MRFQLCTKNGIPCDRFLLRAFFYWTWQHRFHLWGWSARASTSFLKIDQSSDSLFQVLPVAPPPVWTSSIINWGREEMSLQKFSYFWMHAEIICLSKEIIKLRSPHIHSILLAEVLHPLEPKCWPVEVPSLRLDKQKLESNYGDGDTASLCLPSIQWNTWIRFIVGESLVKYLREGNILWFFCVS